MSAVAVYYLDGVDFYANSEEYEAVNQAGRDLLYNAGYIVSPTDEVTAVPSGDKIYVYIKYSSESLSEEGLDSFYAELGFAVDQPAVQPIVEAIRKLPRQAS